MIAGNVGKKVVYLNFIHDISDLDFHASVYKMIVADEQSGIK